MDLKALCLQNFQKIFLKMKLLNYFTVIIFVVYVINSSSVLSKAEDTDCSCNPVEKQFNEVIQDKIKQGCRKCYSFTYDFTLDQDWAAYLCINSSRVSRHTPLLITVREYLSILSFQVPQVFDDKSNSFFTYVCHTLCPLDNYFDEKLNASKQNIYVELTTEELDDLDFTVQMSKINNFTIQKLHPITVNITPSTPQVRQYSMEEDLRAVRIEVTSPDESCMVLAIQKIQCPFSDFEKTVEQTGYYQTLMKQSGIAITKNFRIKQLYIVLLLKPTNVDCLDNYRTDIIPVQNVRKEVTVTIVPAITDANYYGAIFGALGFFLLIYIFTFFICMFIWVRKSPETLTMDIKKQEVLNYGTSSSVENSVISNRDTSSNENAEDSYSAATKASVQELSSARIEIDEPDMDTLPDATYEKNVIRTKKALYVADLSRKKDRSLSKKTKIYSWNCLTIAIFYALPVFQLVYINQRIVNLTGNQDLCYYNFLCSHQVWVFSDFNHVYSNIGYGLLGFLFIFLVRRRQFLSSSTVKDRSVLDPNEITGIPHHFGLLYAMGLALIIEGVLSACYHVCPNKSNFQFDTAFMYVISAICLLKLYQARHPDITAESHTTWMIMAGVIFFCGIGGLVNGGAAYWIIFCFLHLVVTVVVSVKIYYMGVIKFNTRILKRMHVSVIQQWVSKSYYPQFKWRFILIMVAAMVNISFDLYALVQLPMDSASFILVIFMSNLGMYLVYYIIMKFVHKERIGWIPILFSILSVICWIAAGIFFFAHNTSWKVTPAESREKNKHCLILDFFDHHDIWHFISSCALFFSFMVLFTLDDDLDNTPRGKITVF